MATTIIRKKAAEKIAAMVRSAKESVAEKMKTGLPCQKKAKNVEMESSAPSGRLR